MVSSSLLKISPIGNCALCEECPISKGIQMPAPGTVDNLGYGGPLRCSKVARTGQTSVPAGRGTSMQDQWIFAPPDWWASQAFLSISPIITISPEKPENNFNRKSSSELRL